MLFTVRLKAKSWNSIACKHFRVYKAAADEAKMATRAAIIEHKLEPVTEFPVAVWFHAKWTRNGRRDIDALYCKAVLDQLVLSGILPDDNLKYVNCAVYTGETKSDADELVVKIGKLSNLAP